MAAAAAASPAAPMEAAPAAAIAAEAPPPAEAAVKTPRKKQPPPPIPPQFDFSQPPVIEGFEPSAVIMREETFKEKFMRKTKENPFVPIGCLGTAGALMWGLRAFNQGKTRQSQLMMRGRIVAQGFTVVAIIVGVLSSALKAKE